MEQSKFYQIKNVTEHEYTLVGCDGSVITLPIQEVDKTASVFTIQDAKDGDVLAAHECYVIFKEIDELNIKCYCTYHYMGYNPSFYIDTLQNKDAFHPATKEQCDQLEKAMADAGYTFDFEKKELRKIEQKFAEWGEEDETILNNLIYALANDRIENDRGEYISFLKSLRPQNWTNEDKERYISCLQRLSTGNPEQPETINSKWFKEHVYPQSHWKPSDEQIEALDFAADCIVPAEFCFKRKVLKELLEQLKKLREE